MDVRSGGVVGLEALVRWRHPQRGLVPPATFIPIAEEAGLIQEIGAWVLDEALRQTALWQAQGLPVVPVAVNLSVGQFRHPVCRRTSRRRCAAMACPRRCWSWSSPRAWRWRIPTSHHLRIAALKQLGVTCRSTISAPATPRSAT
jgi:hypothetical protein